MNEKLQTYSLAAVGLVQGVFRYFIAPAVIDLPRTIERKLGIPSQEELDKYISELAEVENGRISEG